MLRTLKTITFVYAPQEDRIAAAINAGGPDAWSCWLTRRLALAVLERATEYLANTSDLAQRAPAELLNAYYRCCTGSSRKRGGSPSLLIARPRLLRQARPSRCGIKA